MFCHTDTVSHLRGYAPASVAVAAAVFAGGAGAANCVYCTAAWPGAPHLADMTMMPPASRRATSALCTSSRRRAAAAMCLTLSIRLGTSSCSATARHLSTAAAKGPQLLKHPLAPLALFYNDVYEVPLPPTHRFPMPKYRMVREVLQAEFASAASSSAALVTFTVSPLASCDDLTTTHCPEYVGRFLSGELTAMENRRIGFPWSQGSVNRTLSSVGGTIAAAHAVCTSPAGKDAAAPFMLFAGHIAGGTHHAFYDRGEGFCVFSDIAVAANVALRDYRAAIRKILIVDLDVHQGNGNAKLFGGNDAVFTFSLHCKANYFSARQYSDLDVEVDAGVGDEEYLKLVEHWVPQLMDQVKPDLVFFQAGVDPLSVDRLGQLRLTRQGLARRNSIVFDAALQRCTRLVVTMGGGYPRDMTLGSPDYLEVVAAHTDVYRNAALALARQKSALVRWP